MPHLFVFFGDEWVTGVGAREGKSENDATVESHPSKNEGWGTRPRLVWEDFKVSRASRPRPHRWGRMSFLFFRGGYFLDLTS